ncbi:PEGA domain-containing protein [Noviherbaspirillum massiliense]|uniref:PEGA domain-containing protein n=1 Tax=Noviherbaspirillum massiliense TaxID=1465823 RepID=UPI000474DA9B|nr:PEGA domain-containing protein [Noviherbaspirillum massiliense]
MNRTFIGSVLFIDIVGYSLRTVPDQLAMKELFNELLGEAIQNVAPSDRIMVDTGDGAAIAFIGDPEDALFAALSLRDAIASGRASHLGEPGFVRMGINLGPLKAVRDINGHTNMIGDGVNDAQRVMSFAEPGQVMVSHSYYDIISRFSHDYTKLFVYEGTRHDKHVREHEVYRFGPLEDTEDLAEKLRDRSRARHTDIPAEPLRAKARRLISPQTNAAAEIRKNKGFRIGLISLLVGAATMVGAVWSWTSKPEKKAAAVAPEIAAPAVSQPTASAADVKTASTASASAVTTKPAETAEKAGSDEATAVKPGKVKLSIQPWGEIYVDGSKRGISPPLKSLTLPPGEHKIEVRNGQFVPYRQTIEVKSGGEATVKYAF